ncbi:hypothetical protein OROMI_008794 [Orobanche minor]
MDHDNDNWLSPHPSANEESRVRLSGPELARLFEDFAETDAKISKDLFEAEQRNWAAICKRRSEEEKNQLDLKVDNPEEEHDHNKDMEAPKEDSRDKRD